MPNEVIKVPDIQGLMPALDRRVVGKPYVIDGANFAFDVQGPKSCFGTRRITQAPFSSADLHASTIRIGDEIWLFADDGIYGFNPDTKQFFPRFVSPTIPTDDWLWSAALVGGNWFFCRKGIGLVKFDTATEVFSIITDDVPSGPVSICESYGRLVVLGATAYAWSSLDLGEDLAPDLNTGAGSRSTGLVGGTSFSVRPIETGFLVYTSKGILISEFTAAENQFRSDVLTKQIRPISPFAIIDLEENIHLFLDVKGLYMVGLADQNTRVYPRVFNQIFSEYLSQDFLPTLNLRVANLLRLFYSIDTKQIFLSVSSEDSPGAYIYSFCLYQTVEKWGKLNHPHYMLGELAFPTGSTVGFQFGYFCLKGDVHHIREDVSSTEEDPNANDTFLFIAEEDFPIRVLGGVYYFSSNLYMYDHDPQFYASGTGVYETYRLTSYTDETDLPEEMEFVLDTEVYYAASEFLNDTGMVLFNEPGFAEKNLQPLKAYIDIGLFRFPVREFNDELSMITNVTIGQESLSLADIEDWLTLTPDVTQDWLVDTLPDEDWGDGVAGGNSYDTLLIGTNDGETSFNQAELTLARQEGDSAFYVVLLTAMYHTLRVSALQSDQSFHLKSLELSGNYAGRLG